MDGYAVHAQQRGAVSKAVQSPDRSGTRFGETAQLPCAPRGRSSAPRPLGAALSPRPDVQGHCARRSDFAGRSLTSYEGLEPQIGPRQRDAGFPRAPTGCDWRPVRHRGEEWGTLPPADGGARREASSRRLCAPCGSFPTQLPFPPLLPRVIFRTLLPLLED